MKERKGQMWIIGLMAGMYFLWLRKGDWGAGLTIINLVCLVLMWQKTKKKSRMVLFLYGSSAVLGLMMALRAYEVLRVVTVLAIWAVNMLISAWQKEMRGGLMETAITLVTGIFKTVEVVAEEVFGLVGKKGSREGKQGKKMVAGIMLSVPVLIVFLVLFRQADPIFGKIISEINWPEINWRFMGEMGGAIIFGVVVGAILKTENKFKLKIKNYWQEIGALEVTVVILQVLFALFALVQLRYFLVSEGELKAMGINFSNYTRQGYGEMLFACFLAIGVMMVIGEMKKFDKRKSLAKLYAAEIWLFVATATRRNYFYQANNGFTRVRLWGFGLSILMTAVVVAVLIKIVRNKGEGFLAKAGVTLIVSFVLGLNLANIDGMISRKPARINGEIDCNYLARLSNDALPAWNEVLEGAKSEKNYDGWDKERSLNYFLKKKEELEKRAETKWQNGGSWNISDKRALDWLKDNEGRIREIR